MVGMSFGGIVPCIGVVESAQQMAYHKCGHMIFAEGELYVIT